MPRHAEDVLDVVALRGAGGITARALCARVASDEDAGAVVGERIAEPSDDDAEDALAMALACVERGDVEVAPLARASMGDDGDVEGMGGIEARGARAKRVVEATLDAKRRGVLEWGMDVTFTATRAARARALGIGDEGTWENKLSENARAALEIVGARERRGATGSEINAANGGKNADHLVKALLGAGLVAIRKTSARETGGSIQNLVYLKRFEPSGKSHDAERGDYYAAFTRILSEAQQGTATSKFVRESLLAEFENSSLFKGLTSTAKTKVFSRVKTDLCRGKFIEPVMSNLGDAVRLLKPYDVMEDELDGEDEDEDDGLDESWWTGRGVRGGIVIEQTLETQVCQRLREAGRALTQEEILRDFDVASRTLEKRFSKMHEEDELFKRVMVQRGKTKTACFVANDTSSEASDKRQGDDGGGRMEIRTKMDPMLVDDASRRHDLVLKELRGKGFLYVNRLGKWLADAEGGMYKRVDKELITALVDSLVDSGNAIVLDMALAYDSSTERQPDRILFHIDYPFDPASAEDAPFVEALKEDIRATDVAVRQSMSKKLASNEVVRIEPMEVIPSSVAPIAALPLNELTDVEMEPVQDFDTRVYRNLNDFHAIGLGYIRAFVVRLECLHMYLVAKVFGAGIEDGTINDEILGDLMPISMYIKLVNSAESKTLTAEDLDEVRAEALRGKLMRDLRRELRDKMRSVQSMNKLKKRLTELGLAHEAPKYDQSTSQMFYTLKLTKSARFQIKVAKVDDDDSWSRDFDVTTAEGAKEYWSTLEETFKGKPGMDKAQPASSIDYPRLTSTRTWARKYDLGLENCVILTDRLRESWRTLLKLLLVQRNISFDEVDLADESSSKGADLMAKSIECLAENGLPKEDALRAEQLAQDVGIPDQSGLSLVKEIWRNYCYRRICAAVTDGIISSQTGARALNLYARSARFRVTRRLLYRSWALPQGSRSARNPARLEGLTSAVSPPKPASAAKENLDINVSEANEVFDDDDSDGEYNLAAARRKAFIFGASEDEFLVFCMIRFIALSGTNAFRSEKRDYRASLVYNDQMWRSRYPTVRQRAVVDRWRRLTVGEGDEDEAMSKVRHDAILRIGAEYYERGARARRDNALPHRPSPIPKSEFEVERWDETWDGTGKWSDGVAKQVLQSTRSILREFPISYDLPKREAPRPKLKREEKVRRIRAGRTLTEADDDIILARLAPIAFLRRRAISFQDESGDSDEEDVSDYDDDSDVDEELSTSPKGIRAYEVSASRLEALTCAQHLLDADKPKHVSCVAPNGPQLLALCSALVDQKISMSTTNETVTSALPPAFDSSGDSAGVYFNSPNVALKSLHGVKIEILDSENTAVSDVSGPIDFLQTSNENVKMMEPHCMKVIQGRDRGMNFNDLIGELRSSKIVEAAGARGADAVRRALDNLTAKGSVRVETSENEIMYFCRRTKASTSWAVDDVEIKACARAVLGVVLNHSGASETRLINSLGDSFLVHVISHAVKFLVDEGVLVERVIEKLASVIPPTLGGSTIGDDQNVAERFFFADESSAKTIEILTH